MYELRFATEALAEIEAIVEHISRDSLENAKRWKHGVFERTRGVQSQPYGCTLAPENELCDFEVRETYLGMYRLLFTVSEAENAVYVLGVRHGARLPLSDTDLDERFPQ